MIESFPHSFLPKKPFFADNHATIDEILTQLDKDFPKSGASEAFTPAGETPSPEAMKWMWTNLMGRQHGSMEGIEDKVDLSRVDQAPYRKMIDGLHYGTYGFSDEHKINPDVHYTSSLVLGGLPQDITNRLGAGFGNNPDNLNIDSAIIFAGQRLRWRQTSGEQSIDDIYNAVADTTGADMDELREKSPWIREEEAKRFDETNEWSGPYATENEIARLCIEAYFRDLIDWKNYEVSTIVDHDAVERPYLFRNETQIVPARTDAVTTYELINGTKAHILNAAAVPRAQGVPRPTSDSQAKEAVTLGLIGKKVETLNVAVSPPHIRAGLDVFTRLLDERVSIAHAEIATHPWAKDKELITALGEIPATHKADLRLRAILEGKDPDAPELANL